MIDVLGFWAEEEVFAGGKAARCLPPGPPQSWPMPLLEPPRANALGQAVWVGTFSRGLLCSCKEVTKIFECLLRPHYA